MCPLFLFSHPFLTVPARDCGSRSAGRIPACRACCVGEKKVLTRLSTRFPCVLAESPAGYRVSASSVQCIPFPETVVWRRYFLLVAEAEETKQALSGPTDRAASHVFPADAHSEKHQIHLHSQAFASRDSLVRLQRQSTTGRPPTLSSWGPYLWAVGTASRAACGCLLERKHRSAFATS